MEKRKYGKIINNKLYKKTGFIIEGGRIYTNANIETLKKLGYKRIEFDFSGKRICQSSKDGSKIITNMCFEDIPHIASSPINSISSCFSGFGQDIAGIISEINFKIKYSEVLYKNIFEEDNHWCSSKVFKDYIKWRNEKDKEWIDKFDIDLFIKNKGIETDEFFNKYNLNSKNRLVILSRIEKLQNNIKNRNKNVLLTSVYIYIYTKFENYIRIIAKVFKREFGVCKNINDNTGIETVMIELNKKIPFKYKNFLPILCRRNSIIHDDGVLSKSRYNRFKEKCELPFVVEQNITPSLDDVLKEIEIMENVLKELCEKTIEDLKNRGDQP